MIIKTTRFGELEVPEECIISFVDGLPVGGGVLVDP